MKAEDKTVPRPTTWALRVASDSRCADDAQFRSTLEDQIPEEQRVREKDAELVAEVRVRESDGRLMATVLVIDRVLDAPAGSREVELPSDDCAKTAESLSLILGVLIEAGRGVPAPAPPAGSSSEPPEEERAAEPEAVDITPKRYSWLGPRAGHDLAIGPAISYGLIPQLGFGGYIGWGIRIKDVWPFWLSGAGLLPRETSDGRARLSSAQGSIAVCPLHGQHKQVRGRICPSFSAGVIWAEGRGFLEQKRKREVISTLGLEFAGDMNLFGPLTLGLMTRVDVPLLRTEFVYYRRDGTEPRLHKARWLTGTAVLSLGLRFR